MVKDTSIQVKVRMSRAFHHELLRTAHRNDRTLNAEILARLGAVHKSDTLPEMRAVPREFLQKWMKEFREASAKTNELIAELRKAKGERDDDETRIR
jgi:hypothetical protein